jgi:hypothetical protein
MMPIDPAELSNKFIALLTQYPRASFVVGVLVFVVCISPFIVWFVRFLDACLFGSMRASLDSVTTQTVAPHDDVEHQEVIERRGIDIEILAPAIDRIMNSRMHAVILEAIMDAARDAGWEFEYTKEEYELSTWARFHIASVIYPTYVGFNSPRLKVANPEKQKRWEADSIEDGWAAHWLDLTLESLKVLGIRPVPALEVDRHRHE